MEISVQGIALKYKEKIPEEFIRSKDEQPGITTVEGTALEVPVIDLRNPDEEKILESIVDASQKWGMFQVVNHEIPGEVISKLQLVGREFFELPEEEKEKEVYVKPVEVDQYDAGTLSLEGYGTKLQREVQGKKGWVDHLFHKIWPPSAVNYHFWPKNPSYREANEEYAKWVQGAVGGENLVYLAKINYYPPCPQPEVVLGVVAHTDMNNITILVPNDVQGLQAFRDGLWYDVKCIPNALVIHIGDQMEILSNGRYKSVLHRTRVNKEKTRMSWPVFLEPPADFQVGPHPKLVNENNPAKYKTKKYSDYVYCKLNKIPQ
ncbi:hypothetical protein Ddye_006173 [Dipteronia dyeriana]|uniref:Fe2OG dioxygenase domain-containing protein n=1 Tax=Dipteronia dyeriana TaxID=168575 RepID=A0AAD9XHI9_9ROSI|nr:hypothetical protein Ddye_006173 [Dipteronia dyeriana]